MLVRSCFLITLIKCFKGHRSLGSLFNVKNQNWLSDSLSEWGTMPHIELYTDSVCTAKITLHIKIAELKCERARLSNWKSWFLGKWKQISQRRRGWPPIPQTGFNEERATRAASNHDGRLFLWSSTMQCNVSSYIALHFIELGVPGILYWWALKIVLLHLDMFSVKIMFIKWQFCTPKQFVDLIF